MNLDHFKKKIDILSQKVWTAKNGNIINIGMVINNKTKRHSVQKIIFIPFMGSK
jgi:hypothetical protein